jgi:hypothetical protein
VGNPMHPVVVFSTFRSEAEPTMRSWARFRNQIKSAHPHDENGYSESTLGKVHASQSRQTGTFWRLMAPNHRELARSYFLYSSLATARNHVIKLIEQVDQISVLTLRGEEVRTHGWYATIDGEPVMTCGRWYEGSAASISAAAGSLRSLAAAVVSETGRSTDPRRLMSASVTLADA